MNSLQTWHEEDFSEVKTLGFCGGTLTVFTCRCPGKGSSNEDSAGIIQLSPTHGVIVVADGVGGASVGARASRCAVEQIAKALTVESDGNAQRASIVDAIEAANQEILSWGLGAATTVSVVEFLDGRFRTFHAGDSSILQFSNRGKLKSYTVAHAPIAMAVESGMLEEAEGLLHEDRNLISNCVGCEEMKIEIGPDLEFAKLDTLVLASDGLTDNFTTAEVMAVLRKSGLPKQSQRMIEMTQKRMLNAENLPSKADDLTMICFRQ